MIRRLSALAAMVAAVAWTYFPAAGFAFLNWDDQSVDSAEPVARIPRRGEVGVDHHLHGTLPATQLAGVGGDQERVRSRSRARFMRPTSRRMPSACCWSTPRRGRPDARGAAGVRSALATARPSQRRLLFGLHPLRVEVVAWISAMPYALALAFLLASLLAYLTDGGTSAGAATGGGARTLCRRRWPQARRSGLPGGAGGDRPLAAQAAHAHEPVHGVAVRRAGTRRRRRRERGARAGHRRRTVALPAAIGGVGAVRLSCRTPSRPSR